MHGEMAVSKFFEFLKQAILDTPDEASENSIKEIKAINRKLEDVTIDGEYSWHLCWSDKQTKKKLRSKNV